MAIDFVAKQLYIVSNVVVTVDVIFVTNTQNARVVVIVDVLAAPRLNVKARGSGC